jgi:tetratricopeptide (TPR) repeat protein
LLSQHLIAAQNTNEKIFGEGTESLRRGDNAAAEKAFLTVLKSEPNNLAALGNLGIVYVRTNRPAKAIDTYERALKLAPQEKGLLLNLGLAYFKQEQYTRAFPKFQQVKALDPTNSRPVNLPLPANSFPATSKRQSPNSKPCVPSILIREEFFIYQGSSTPAPNSPIKQNLSLKSYSQGRSTPLKPPSSWPVSIMREDTSPKPKAFSTMS